RRVDMSQLLHAVLKRHVADEHVGGRYTLCRKADEPLLESTVHEAFRWVLRKSQWKVLRGLHVLRHSFASNLAATGIHQRIIDELRGHKRGGRGERYRHLLPEQRRNAINSVFGSSNGTATKP